MDLSLSDLFGKTPKTILTDNIINDQFVELQYDILEIQDYLENVLQLESVACKDWLTNKVDRSVTGKIALQQCAGELQLPLNNLGAVAIDYQGVNGIATSIGHAPVAALIDAAKGSVLAISEALTNIVWAPLRYGLKGVSLSANWMWPARNEGENARLYSAVEAASKFAISLGINIPTGKDSLSMTQKYPDGQKVLAPGTVVISAVAEVSDVKKIVKPVLSNDENTDIIYVPFTKSGFELGGSSFAQTFGMLGMTPPDISDPEYFKKSFEAIQNLLNEGLIIAGHDISSGGLITALLEMNFSNLKGGLDIDLTELCEKDLIRLLFSEKPAVIIQVKKDQEVLSLLKSSGIVAFKIGRYVSLREVRIQNWGTVHHFDIDSLRDIWFKTSYLFDRNQTKPMFALARYRNYKKQPLIFNFSDIFLGKFSQFGIKPKEMGGKKIKAAIIREKGVNGDREMAWALHLAGFEVKDIHTTDLIKGTEGLEEINFIVFVGGFSNSDVFGSGKGWAGALLYNDKANTAIRNFYSRADTLSLGICNGCQVMTELGLIYPDHKEHPKMKNNDSGKFESAFLTVDILPNNSVMLKSLTGSRLGIWLANGEGRFHFPQDESNYCIPIKYSYQEYPGNPNGSPFGAAGIVSYDGRHLAMMPHIERAIFPWQWPYYPEKRKTDQMSPWFEAFVNAREWLTEKLKA